MSTEAEARKRRHEIGGDHRKVGKSRRKVGNNPTGKSQRQDKFRDWEPHLFVVSLRIFTKFVRAVP